MKNGFALAITLLFLLLLVLLGFSLLVIAGNYYASTRNLLEKENDRIACEQAIRAMLDRHNLGPTQPRFFFDPQVWQKKKMRPFRWMEYEISASIAKNWDSAAPNTLTTTARKATYAVSREVQIRQKRFEDFALYLDGDQDLDHMALFDGPGFVRGTLNLFGSGSLFRQPVQGNIQPREHAVFRRSSSQVLAYPEAASWLGPGFFQQQAQSRGVIITSHNPLFWTGSRYEFNFDLIQVENRPGNLWRINYNGANLGTVPELLLWFDDTVSVSQSSPLPAFLIQKPNAPLYVASARDIVIRTGIHAVEDTAFRHPISLAADHVLRLDSTIPKAVCLDVFLLALGAEPSGETERSLFIADGGAGLDENELDQFRSAIITSAFLVETQQRMDLERALELGERIVWFRGGLVLARGWAQNADPVNLHFQSGSDAFPLLPPLPFIYEVEGSERWL